MSHQHHLPMHAVVIIERCKQQQQQQPSSGLLPDMCCTCSLHSQLETSRHRYEHKRWLRQAVGYVNELTLFASPQA